MQMYDNYPSILKKKPVLLMQGDVTALLHPRSIEKY